MSTSLVYVNREMIIGLAVPFLGSEMRAVKRVTASGGFNWIVQAQVGKVTDQGTSVQIRDMRPEAIAGKLLPQISDDVKFSNVDDCTKKITEWSSEDNAGKLILVSGVLKFDMEISGSYDPTSPPSVNVKTFLYNQSECFACELTSDGVKLPVYFSSEAALPVSYCNSKSVDIVGSLGWVPFYDAGKSRTINSILCGAAMWVK